MLEAKRKELQAQMKIAQAENDRVRAEKEELQKQKGLMDSSAREELLAEARVLKEELQTVKTEDGKVPGNLVERLQQIQQRLSTMGLAAEKIKTFAEQKESIAKHKGGSSGQKVGSDTLQHL